jgi:hypothetical protein
LVSMNARAQMILVFVSGRVYRRIRLKWPNQFTSNPTTTLLIYQIIHFGS